MLTRECLKCGETKPLSDFHKHPLMKSGYVNKCKKCNNAENKANREAKVEYYREQDRLRGSRTSKEALQRYREKNPKKYRAHSLVNEATRTGRLTKLPCEVCGAEKTHAHHCDYNKPMEVMWLCPVHHAAWHKEHGEGLNAH